MLEPALQKTPAGRVALAQHQKSIHRPAIRVFNE
jgi:hypothetical protein